MQRSSAGLSFLICSIVLVCFGFACNSEPEIDGRKISDWVNLLRHQDWKVQEEAADALSRMGAVAVPYLVRGLQANHPTLRQWIVKTLGRIGPPAKSAIDRLLIRISREEVPLIRREILIALASIDPTDPRVKAEFTKRLRDMNESVRNAAKEGLEKSKPKVVKPAVQSNNQPVATTERSQEFLLREVVAEELAKTHPQLLFAMLAEVVRAERRAAIIWPGIKNNQLTDRVAMALVFEQQTDKSWKKVDQVDELDAARGPTKLAQALGGADKQRVIKPCGIPQETLPSYLYEHGRAFADSLKEKKAQDAMARFEKLTHAFSFSRLVYDDLLIRLVRDQALVSKWQWQYDKTKNKAKASGIWKDTSYTCEIALRPCGSGVEIARFQAKANATKP